MFLYRTLEAMTVSDEKREKTHWRNRREKLYQHCQFVTHQRMNVIGRIARAKFKHRMRVLFPVMFPGVNIPRFKQGQNKRTSGLWSETVSINQSP